MHIAGSCQASHQPKPQVILFRAALNPFSIQPVLVLGIALVQTQDLEPHEVHTGPALKPVKVPLDGIPSFLVDRTTQLGVIGKSDEGAVNFTVHITNKDVNYCWSQY